MQQITTKRFETDIAFNLNKSVGLPLYYQCDICKTISYETRYVYNMSCKCGGILRISREAFLYRDCGCTVTSPKIKFTLRRYKNFRCKSNIVENYDIMNLVTQYNIKSWIYLRVGALTQFRFNINNYNLITGDIESSPTNPAYRVYLPKDGTNIIVNNMPFKFYYTEYTESSYRGYFITHIFALDYDPITRHLEACKLLRRLQRDKKSYFHWLPKELILHIRDYMIKDLSI